MHWKVVEVMAAHTSTELRILLQRSYETLGKHDLYSPPRSQLCASAVNDMLGMAVSYAIADSRFLSVTKPKVSKFCKYMFLNTYVLYINILLKLFFNFKGKF